MARILKTGAEYFPLDAHTDDRIRLIEAEHGLVAFAVIVRLWQKIYGGRGYYFEFDSDAKLMFSHEQALDIAKVDEIVSSAVRRGVFDGVLYDKFRILTSPEIQLQYLQIMSRRERVDLDERFLLIEIPEKIHNVYINGLNVNKKPQNADSGTQRKEKESKENQNIINKSKSNNAPFERGRAQRRNGVSNKNYSPKGFKNYTDTEEVDYNALEKKILDMMFE